MRAMSARWFLLSMVLALAYSAHPAAYLQLAANVSGRTVPLRWPASPIRWYVSTQGSSDLAPALLQASAARAFDTWQNVPTASVAFTFAGFTSGVPFDEDGLSVL